VTEIYQPTREGKKMKLRMLLAMMAVLLIGCADTATNEIGLSYGGGPFEDKGYQGTLDPGLTAKVVGIGDAVYRYRIDQRSWIGRNCDEPGCADRAEIEFVSKDGIRMTAPIDVYFTLRQDEEALRRFHEEIGLKTQAWTEEGWVEMLRTYFDPSLDRGIDSAGLAYDWRPLREDEGIRNEFATRASEQFSEELERATGGNYFCSPNYQKPEDDCGQISFAIGQPTPVDAKVVEAVEAEQTANARTQSLAAEERRAEAEARARQVLIDQVGPEVYACLEASKVADRHGHAPPPCVSGATPVVPVG
jgi:hypothetical protein